MSDTPQPKTTAPAPENVAVKAILATAIVACVSAAGEAECCAHKTNPKWWNVRDALDQCTDILREVETNL